MAIVHQSRLAACALLLASQSSIAETGMSVDAPHDGASDGVKLEIFQGPERIVTVSPHYPQDQRQLGHEGWVRVHFMIDPDGAPYEIAVTESTGIRALERAATESVAKWRYRPAQVNGQPIHVGHTTLLTFSLSGPGGGNTGPFVRAYNRFAGAIEKGDRQAADRLLANLPIRNHQDDSYAGFARYLYARKWGSVREQVAGLRRATAADGSRRFLPDDLYRSALNNLFALEIESSDYAAAYRTWTELQALGIPNEERPGFEQAVSQIEALQRDERSFTYVGAFDDATSAFHWLLKNRFRIIVDSGAVEEIKLRCDRGYVMFRYDPALQYQVDEKDGLCQMELVGDPGTQFRVVQF